MKINQIVSVSGDTLGGAPVFKGTRVPIECLFEHLQNGISLDDFLEDFPSVSRELAVEILEIAKLSILSISTTGNLNESFNRRKSA